MIKFIYEIPFDVNLMLMSPEEAFKRMLNIEGVYEEFPQILNELIARNFKRKSDENGAWKPLSQATKDLRFNEGVAKISNDFKPNRYNEILKASGDYYESMTDIEDIIFNEVDTEDIFNSEMFTQFDISTDDVPGLWNEFEHKTSGAIRPKNPSTVPRRSVLNIDKEAEDRIVDMVIKSLDTYWS